MQWHIQWDNQRQAFVLSFVSRTGLTADQGYYLDLASALKIVTTVRYPQPVLLLPAKE